MASPIRARTDKDLVWTLGEGDEPGEEFFTKRSVWTSPYTPDPAKLTPRRLRSDPAMNLGVNEFVVGCGFAAHANPDPRHAFLVRISDGLAWTMGTASNKFRWSRLIGITCEHAYFFALHGVVGTIARVKLSSLGPGLPPD